ncbi:MAG TPA: hypothetical protein VLB45_04680 [Nitrosopumilaceae archaeon]|nr:hypothetical protein [Nitrosopumilaceae archaeon]
MESSKQKNSDSIDEVRRAKINLKRMFTKRQELTVETVVNTVWISTFLALILTIPSLIIFMGIYFSTGNILLGAVVGFGLHFIGLAFSAKISEGLLRIMS